MLINQQIDSFDERGTQAITCQTWPAGRPLRGIVQLEQRVLELAGVVVDCEWATSRAERLHPGPSVEVAGLRSSTCSERRELLEAE